MEGDQPLRRDAAHRPVAHGPGAGQRIGRVELPVLGRSVDAAPVVAEHDDVEVDLAAGEVAEHEVPGAGVVAWHGRKTTALKRTDGRGTWRFSMAMSRSRWRRVC